MAAVSLSHIPAAHAACGAQSSSYRNEQDSTAYFTSAMPSRRTLAIKMERPASPAWNKSPHSAAVCRCMFDESILDPTMVIDAETKTPRKKTGAELREEFFLAAATVMERGYKWKAPRDMILLIKGAGESTLQCVVSSWLK
eukprot:TRINITY_DN2531_c0_g1_i1.p1 TRINITY_DN2531_c0_g1~~TRINITY_DN2531_c0_g1_i1.p1  ORF type:complete len:151 (+),score=22.18 TRINITY_DN2531_c0_g1_i1:32-454(+)